jgi:hypothetical protein
MAQLVYILCGLTSILCGVLLYRQYRLTGGALLFWSMLCFLCLAVTNVLLYLDLVVFPSVNLAVLRNAITLSGMMMLLYGLIREST